jgi:hypothetical protein
MKQSYLDVNQLKDGIYLLEVLDLTSGMKVVEKIVKE